MPKNFRFEFLQKLSTIRDLFLEQLREPFGEREAMQLFLTACLRIDNKERVHIALGEKTSNKDLYISCLEQLVSGVPIQYIFGLADFDGLLLKVNKEVLIPRPETEELVHWVALSLVDKNCTILDLCTGSACIALALKNRIDSLNVLATDVSSSALEVAKENAANLGLTIQFSCEDALSTPIPECDVIVSNPPYIPKSQKDEMAVQVTAHEPEIALFVPDHAALIFYERIAQTVSQRGIEAFVEIHEDLKVELEKMLHKFGVEYTFKKDMQQKWRMLHLKADYETI